MWLLHYVNNKTSFLFKEPERFAVGFRGNLTCTGRGTSQFFPPKAVDTTRALLESWAVGPVDAFGSPVPCLGSELG